MSTTDPAATPAPAADPFGDDRRRLEAVRDKLAARIEADDPDLPALSRELRQVLNALRDLPAPRGASGVDQIKAARERREAAAS